MQPESYKFRNKKKQHYDKNSKPINVSVGETVYLRQKPYDKLGTLNKKYVVTEILHPNVKTSDGKTASIVHKNRIIKKY